MKNVHGLVSLALVLGLASGCGRATTVSSLTAAQSSATTAAVASTSALWVEDTSLTEHIFTVTASTGNLTAISLESTNQNVTIQMAQTAVVGTWTYQVNLVTNAIDQYATSNLNVIVHSFVMTDRISRIGLAVNN